MSSSPPRTFFGPFDVTNQVFLTTAHSFALVNLKPLLPGHVLVCPNRPHKRLTDLSPPELTDLFTTVQRIQVLLARKFFPSPNPSAVEQQRNPGGSFNIALQDGPEAGQTVPHAHVHIIPRVAGSTGKTQGTLGDAIYEEMAAEAGNVGGGLWDLSAQRLEAMGRPRPGGEFPRIEDCERKPRSDREMEEEADGLKTLLREIEVEEGRA